MSSPLWPAGSDAPELAEHQRDAVAWVRDRLERHGAAILADEVGLGKSWVAASVASRSTGAVEIIVPAALRSTWREVCSKFELHASIISHEAVRRELAPGRPANLVIVDEAHRFRSPGTKGWRRLGRRLVGARTLLLTATPIWNAPRDLWSLLRLIVPDDELRRAGVASVELAMASEIGRSRVLNELVLRRGHDVLPSYALGDLRARRITYPVPDDWRRIENQIDTLTFPHCLGDSVSILHLLMLRRLHSSPAALRSSIERQLRFCRSGLDLLRRGFRLDRREFTRHLIVDEGIQELLFPQLFLEPADEPDAATLEREIKRLETLLVAPIGDPKADLLATLLAESEPTLLFVGAIDTAAALFERFAAELRCGVATGSLCRSRTGSRSIGAITTEFQEGLIDLLILTDLGAEGLNLQRADRVIHYDLPWSPMRLEQRNGRARRIGREGRDLEIVTFVPNDDSFLVSSVLAEKRRAAHTFWTTSVASSTPGAALDRLPSRITASEPQAKLWSALPPTTDRSLLLRRYVAALEEELRASSVDVALARIRALVSEMADETDSTSDPKRG